MKKKFLLCTVFLCTCMSLHQAHAITDRAKAILKTALGAVLTIGGGCGYFFSNPRKLSNEERYLFYSATDDERLNRLSVEERHRLTELLLGNHFECDDTGRITTIEGGYEVRRDFLEDEALLAFKFAEDNDFFVRLKQDICLALGVSGIWIFLSGLNDWINLPEDDHAEEAPSAQDPTEEANEFDKETL